MRTLWVDEMDNIMLNKIKELNNVKRGCQAAKEEIRQRFGYRLTLSAVLNRYYSLRKKQKIA